MIQVEGLSKSFGSIRAVDGITFSVGKGEILGFLGPNGAGKSTTMKMITTFLAPTSGTARVGGFDILDDHLEVRRRVGYLPESAPSYKDMNVFDFLSFAAEVRGYDGEERRNRVMRMIETCNLKEVAWQLIDTLSKGYRQRVGVAQALLHDPEYLVLDEPTDGLDPNQKQEVRSLIRRMGRDKCIILSTHILEEVDAVCSRAIIIGNGRIVADGSPADLRRRSTMYGAVTIELVGVGREKALAGLAAVAGVGTVRELSDSAPPAAVAAEASEGAPAQGTPGAATAAAAAGAGRLRVRLFPKAGAAIAQEVARFIHTARWEVDAFTIEQGDLNEVFYNLTKGGRAVS